MSLGLPAQIRAGLFDLDGVITQTAKVHAQAWKQVFDEFLKTKGQRPFDPIHDYDQYVDGKPRGDRVPDFLASRHITAPDGTIDHTAPQNDHHYLHPIHPDRVHTYDP